MDDREYIQHIREEAIADINRKKESFKSSVGNHQMTAVELVITLASVLIAAKMFGVI